MEHIQLKTREGELLSKLVNLDPENTLKNLMVHSEVLEPGLRSIRSHRHTEKEECVIVQQGQLSIYENGESIKTIASGEAYLFPPGGDGFHFLKNDSDKPVSYVSVATKFQTDKVEFED